MIFASLTTATLLAQLAVGGGIHSLFPRHHAAKVVVVETAAADCCDDCGIESARVAGLIARLKTCPRWQDRDNAAHALRKVKAKCHPEAVAALSFAMLKDCHEEVREEAAETLAVLAPCDPFAHEAVSIAAARDPDHATRKQARKALARMGDRCVGDCQICDPGPAYAGGPSIDLIPPIVIDPSRATPDQPRMEYVPGDVIVPETMPANPELSPIEEVPPPAPEAISPFSPNLPGARRSTLGTRAMTASHLRSAGLSTRIAMVGRIAYGL
ncbi:HEAT repeat domain-containing protein [Isosphaeraceae bacterium EP7]